MRIDKFLSQLKYGSRKEIKEMIKAKRIRVDHELISDFDYDVDPNKQNVYVDDEQVFYQSSIYLMIYKPKGYLSAHHDSMHPCVMDLVPSPYNRFDLNIAGRLDLDAEGLLVLSNEGSFIHQVTHPKSHLPKTYEVVLDQQFSHEKELLAGVEIKDGKNETYLAQALNLKIDRNHVIIVIDEGKFHQVKRMFGACGYQVLNLKRTKIGQLALGDLEPGACRPIRKEDLYD